MTPALAWTLISAALALVAAWGFLDAWGDLRALDGRRNGRRRIARGVRPRIGSAGHRLGALLASRPRRMVPRGG